jgi:hypothetical protein
MANLDQPRSLPGQLCDPYVFDAAHFDDLLRANSERTFVQDDRLQIKLVEVGNKGKKSVRHYL